MGRGEALRCRKVLLIMIFLVLASITAVLALSSPGSQSDPLIPLSYLNDKYIPSILEESEARVQAGLNPIYEKSLQEFEGKQEDWLVRGENKALYEAVIKKLQTTGTTKFTDMTVRKGDVLTGKPGTGMIIQSGTAAIVGPANGVLINVTVGAERKPGNATMSGVYYMVALDDGTGLKVTSDSAVIAVSGNYSLTPAYTIQYQKVADALNSLNLFKGTNSGYQLDRPATRIEALIMLIRLLGEEDAALSFSGENPFTDVPAWAAKYGAYAYSKGYTTGTAKDKFTPSADATKEQYMTFVLRALSYSDASGDFNWQQSLDFSVQAGVIDLVEETKLQSGQFYRDQVVFVSFRALSAKLKDSNSTLSQKLIGNNVFTEDAFNTAKVNAGVE